MPKITKELVFSTLNDGNSHRKQFSQHSGIQRRKDKPTFSVPFDNGLVRHFLDGTGKRLTFNRFYNQHYCFVDEKEMAQVERWEADQGSRVFIRNCLDSTVALDFNFEDNFSGGKTETGSHEEAAKHSQDFNSLAYLCGRSIEAISGISYLARADFICAVPAMAEKGFDLPTELARMISEAVGVPNLTESLHVKEKRKSLKECTLLEKWAVWEEAKIIHDGIDISGKSVILLDDKYQSGVTMQFFGAYLQNLGASEVHGLCMVKTLRDTDNSPVVE